MLSVKDRLDDVGREQRQACRLCRFTWEYRRTTLDKISDNAFGAG